MQCTMPGFDSHISPDPLTSLLGNLSPLVAHGADYECDECPSRGLSEASTDVGSNCSQGSVAIGQTMRHAQHQFASKAACEESFDQPKVMESPEGVGGLLLQAFQIRDNYQQLQEHYSEFQTMAHAEVCALKAELAAAHEQNRMLQAQLSVAHEESCNMKARMHATRAELQALRTKLAVAPKEVAGRLAEGLVQIIGGRSACSNLRVACFEGWHGLVMDSQAQRRQTELSRHAKSEGNRRFLQCRCFCAWAARTHTQQQVHELQSKHHRLLKVGGKLEHLARLVMSGCWQSWATLVLSKCHCVDSAQADARPSTPTKSDALMEAVNNIPLDQAEEVVILTIEARPPSKEARAPSKELRAPSKEARVPLKETKVPSKKSTAPSKGSESCACSLNNFGTDAAARTRMTISSHVSRTCSPAPLLNRAAPRLSAPAVLGAGTYGAQNIVGSNSTLPTTGANVKVLPNAATFPHPGPRRNSKPVCSR